MVDWRKLEKDDCYFVLQAFLEPVHNFFLVTVFSAPTDPTALESDQQVPEKQ